MNMKNFLKKLHITSNNQSEDADGSTSSRGSKSSDVLTSPDKPLHARSPHPFTEHKSFSGLSGWLNSVTNRHGPTQSSSSNVARLEKTELSDLGSNGGLDVGTDTLKHDSGSSNSRDPDIEEEYQIQLALELSAREDPEAVQIEAVKQISLGSCPPENSPAELVAYRYWNYHSLSYDDKILDGFYDLYGVMNESTSEKMPSLVDLQGTPVSDGVTWEAVLVNRASDANLDKLEQKAMSMAIESRLGSVVFFSGELVQRLAAIVSDYMGGPVGDPESMLKAWQSLSYSLKASLGSMVLPLGSLTIGLARHRALLFKVLADSVGIPCRLVKGHQYTGSDGVAMSYVKTEDGREYIVDLMADPGTLIPSDAAGSHIEYDESFFSTSPLSRDMDFSHVASSSSGLGSSFEEQAEFGTQDKRSRLRNFATAGNESDDRGQLTAYTNVISENKGGEEFKISSDFSRNPANVKKELVWDLPSRPSFPYIHGRSPSWTEGVSSPAVRRMKVKDVSQYMIDAAKENPQLAQKLHDVLLESGVVAPANLFAEVLPEELEVVRVGVKSLVEENDEKKTKGAQKITGRDVHGPARFLPPLPYHGVQSKAKPSVKPEHPKFIDDLGVNHPLDLNEATAQPVLSQAEVNPARYVKNVPVAAAAAAAAAVVASSMVVAAAKSSTDSTLELPVAAAATAAAVVATTAAVNKQYEHLETSHLLRSAAACFHQADCMQSDEDTDHTGYEPRGTGDHHHDVFGPNPEGERVSDRSTGNDSAKSDVVLDDVSDCEIPWEEITVGERIGLGSYGEVYRGDWHGTEVAVKRFLEQDISGESLEEFKSEDGGGIMLCLSFL